MIVIRPEVESDHQRVFAVQTAAFGRCNEAELVNVLRASARPSLSLVATEDDELVGHVFFSPVELSTPGAGPPLGALAPIAVHPSRQTRGIGSALIRTGLDGCRELGWRAIFLVGSPDYYARFGFTRAAPMGFTYGHPELDAALQVAELEPGVLTGARGRVHFHAAFSQTGTG